MAVVRRDNLDPRPAGPVRQRGSLDYFLDMLMDYYFLQVLQMDLE
jgi:hypothetical protein